MAVRSWRGHRSLSLAATLISSDLVRACRRFMRHLRVSRSAHLVRATGRALVRDGCVVRRDAAATLSGAGARGFI